MELKLKKSYLYIISVLFISISLILLNGCKKSEPESNTTSGDMSSMNHNMEGMQNMPTETVTADNGQSVCPVMEGNPIDPNIFVEYQGKKVYFCCEDCKAKFQAEPEKYIAQLPQFSEDKPE